jgi:uncharacterized protein with PIN domain
MLLDWIYGMKFIVDSMLGKVSRWLRLLGCMVYYFKEESDDELLTIAKKGDHVLLTRDLGLFRRAKSTGINVVFIEGITIPEMLAHFSQKFKIPLLIDISKSRCPLCNSHIKQIKKKEVAEKVLPGTFKHYNAFWMCTSCGKVYWRGSHWKNINATLQKANTLLKRRNI